MPTADFMFVSINRPTTMSKQINTLDPRQADELVAKHNPVPDDTEILIQTVLASSAFISMVRTTP